MQKTPSDCRAKSVGILTAKFNLSKEARERPMLSWKAVVKACGCPQPLWISLVNTSRAELFFEDSDMAVAEAAMRRKGMIVDSPRVSGIDVHRRTLVYMRGYFRPLRQAAFSGFEKDLVASVLQSAEERAAKLADKGLRKQHMYQIRLDRGLFSQEDSAMEEDGVLPEPTPEVVVDIVMDEGGLAPASSPETVTGSS
jgi:hypothetical protein